MALYNAPAPRVCVENPIGYMNGHFRKPDQIVHPYYFGDPHVKTTCLWLRGLPKLVYPAGLSKPEPTLVQVRRPGKWARGGEIKRRYSTEMAPTRGGHERSVTFHGIANAMAEQWGNADFSAFDKMLDKKQGDFVQTLLF